MSDEKKLSERLEEIAKRECWIDDTSFNPYDYSGGNYDDAYYGGNADGRAKLAREIKDEVAALEKRLAKYRLALARYAPEVLYELENTHD